MHITAGESAKHTGYDEASVDGAAQATLDAMQAQQHPDCVLCGTRNEQGLAVRFRAIAPGEVKGSFAARPLLQSYPETLHGGVTAALLDAAMTNCLFSLGVVAVTAELTIRYLQRINPHDSVVLRARCESKQAPLYRVVAEAHQNGTKVARAKAIFFETSTEAPVNPSPVLA